MTLRPPLPRRRRALLALALALPILAQAPPPQPGLIERVAPVEPPGLGPPLLPPEPQAATGPGATRQVPIGTVRVAGAAAPGAAARQQAVAGLAGRDATLAEIEAARLALLHAYRAAGFAYVAVAARLAAGVEGRLDLRFDVTEGFVAEVVLDGAPIGAAEPQLRRFLDPLVGQRPLPHAALERALLLAGDLPGVEARGLLRPIAGEPGALQLVVRLERRPVTGFASLDNRGYPATGAWQGLLVGQLNSLSRFGERSELALLQTDGNGQSFAQVTEELFLGGSGLRLRGFAGAGRAVPGSALAAIGYAGETRVAGLALAYPLIRARPRNLTLSAQLDAFESVVTTRPFPDAARERASRDAVRALRLGLEGQAQDAWLALAPAAATSTLLLRAHRGLAAFGASDGDHGTTARAGSDFGFFRAVAEVSRLQPLFTPAEGWLVSVYGVAAGQWTDDVLPPAEKFFLGGNRLGRGFYAGEVTGDRALAGSVELQAATDAAPAWAGGLRLGTQLYVFRDQGRAEDLGALARTQRLASWGGGIRLQVEERLLLGLEAVHRLTRTPEAAGMRPLAADALYARVLLRF